MQGKKGSATFHTYPTALAKEKDIHAGPAKAQSHNGNRLSQNGKK
jgi:hypothetical protein